MTVEPFRIEGDDRRAAWRDSGSISVTIYFWLTLMSCRGVYCRNRSCLDYGHSSHHDKGQAVPRSRDRAVARS